MIDIQQLASSDSGFPLHQINVTIVPWAAVGKRRLLQKTPAIYNVVLTYTTTDRSQAESLIKQDPVTLTATIAAVTGTTVSVLQTPTMSVGPPVPILTQCAHCDPNAKQGYMIFIIIGVILGICLLVCIRIAIRKNRNKKKVNTGGATRPEDLGLSTFDGTILI